MALFENWTAEQERVETDRIRAYEQAKFDAGWGALNWPAEYGGRGLPMAYVLAFRREEATFDVPRRTEMFSVTQQLVAPTIAQWGTPKQRERYVRALLRTDLIACQLFSETEAGSDPVACRPVPAPSRARTGVGPSTGTRSGRRALGSPTSGSRCAGPTRTSRNTPG